MGAFGRNATPAGHYHFSKTVGGSSAASSTTNYRQLSGKLSSVVYFDPETARDSVDCGRCLGARFDEWARFAL